MDEPVPPQDEIPPSPDPEWVPQTSLSIGVTGHRLERIGAHRVEDVVVLADELLAAIEKASSSPASPTPLVFRMVTALADGADTIFGEAASARGWRLDVVLPFGREDYAGDFSEGEGRAAYEGLLAASQAVFELHEDRSGQGSGAAYERAGRIVLAQSDLLVAVWDNEPVRGRGGAAQIVAEAVLQGIPVIQIDPAGAHPPRLLWDGLEEHDLGQQTVETVPKGDLSALPRLLRGLLDPPGGADEAEILAWFEAGGRRRGLPALAYPLLLAAIGVRRLGRSDLRYPTAPAGAGVAALCAEETGGDFGSRVHRFLAPRFARADAAAACFAQRFRSGYVANFCLAALAVVLSLLGLALPSSLKPALIVLELATIAVILVRTRVGHRGAWHRRWLDNRHLAERLRCLAVSAQLGELGLRRAAGETPGWVDWYVRATARQLGVPSARVDAAYLGCCRAGLEALVEDQIAYLSGDARRMHKLEHRLHKLGSALFAVTALTCVVLFVFEVAHHVRLAESLSQFANPLLIGATISSAALPAIGAAIYGIRMQGDFAGSAERSEALAHHLTTLRRVMQDDDLDFDTLRRRALRATDLLTEGLGSWLQTYHARPLTLPG